MVPYFSLVLFKGIVRKQITRKYTLKKRTLGCTEGALSGCTKAESLRTGWYVLSKTKTCRIITEVFHFYATCFVLCLLLRILFKIVWELLHLHPKLIFRGALKKVPTVPDVRSYQTQYFTKIFPNPLALRLHIHFYLHLQGSSENIPGTAIALKSATFCTPGSAPETALESTYFMLFLKNVTKNSEKKLVIMLVLIE